MRTSFGGRSPSHELESKSFLDSLDDNTEIAYWLIITIDQKEPRKLICKTSIPSYRSAEEINKKQINQELKDRIAEIITKVNTTILMNQLRSTLECSDLLQIGDLLVHRKPKAEEQSSTASMSKSTNNRVHSKKVSKKYENFSRRTDRNLSIFNSIKEEEDDKTSNPQKKQIQIGQYKVPKLAQEFYFPVSERFRTETKDKSEGLKLLKQSTFFRNFKISNRDNCYLSFYEKELYILMFEEIENPLFHVSRSQSAIDSPELSRWISRDPAKDALRFENENVVQVTEQPKKPLKHTGSLIHTPTDPMLTESKTVILLKIHTLEEFSQKAIDYIINQVSEQLTAESIKLLGPIYFKTANIRLNKSDYDFFTVGVPLKVLLFHFVNRHLI